MPVPIPPGILHWTRHLLSPCKLVVPVFPIMAEDQSKPALIFLSKPWTAPCLFCHPGTGGLLLQGMLVCGVAQTLLC
ncbi:hypothetical protein MHYP_G00016580 [Metynnis hypsauchen]